MRHQTPPTEQDNPPAASAYLSSASNASRSLQSFNLDSELREPALLWKWEQMNSSGRGVTVHVQRTHTLVTPVSAMVFFKFTFIDFVQWQLKNIEKALLCVYTTTLWIDDSLNFSTHIHKLREKKWNCALVSCTGTNPASHTIPKSPWVNLAYYHLLTVMAPFTTLLLQHTSWPNCTSKALLYTYLQDLIGHTTIYLTKLIPILQSIYSLRSNNFISPQVLLTHTNSGSKSFQHAAPFD